MKTVLRLTSCFILLTSTLICAPLPVPEYAAFYNAEKGFKPAQTNLTDIFLQLAGSLEHSGSPELYLKHVLAEDARVSALCEKKTGKRSASRLPAHMTQTYVERLIKNWNTLSPKLDLAAYAKETGLCAREAIRGTRTTGTVAIEVFNEHQKAAIKGMKSGSMTGGDFEALQAKLVRELEFDNPTVNTRGYETHRRDAVQYALIFRGVRETLFKKLESSLPPQDATRLETVIDSIMLDLGRAAHAEFEIGMLEWSLQGKDSALERR